MIKLRQPKALTFLFLTEMWERFGFYIVQGLLVLYLTNYFKLSDDESFKTLGMFSALAYISPIIGGFLANRLFGYQVAITWGGLFLVLGYCLLALPEARTFFYPALATIVVGNGLFKPNISSLLGAQYQLVDSRRESGFTIFYIGINLGALLAGLLSGYIKDYFGFDTSFAVASVGLILGVIIFLSGRFYYQKSTSIQNASWIRQIVLFFGCLIAIWLLSALFSLKSLANLLLPLSGFFILGLLMLLTYREEGEARRKLMTLSILIVSSVVFWMLFFQMFYAANLFVERLVDKEVFGIHLSSTIFWGSESIFIILLGPIFAILWKKLATEQRNPSVLIKFSMALFFTSIGFFILYLSGYFPNENGMVAPQWIFLAYFFITVGELMLSPIGLSAVTQLSPTKWVGLFMGIWFVATGFGGLFAGYIAQFAAIPATIQPTASKIMIYQHAFLYYAYLAIFVAVCLYFVHKFLFRTENKTAIIQGPTS